MAYPGMSMTGTYDPRLVALSVGIAIVASYTALDLAGRVTAARGPARALWLAGGGVAMGIGIWSMHFIGMLAFSLPMPMAYDVPTVLFSLLVAILVSGLALFVVSGRAMSLIAWLVGGLLMGLGIASMHYSGMAGLRMDSEVTYRPGLFVLSVVIACGASLAALWLAFRLRGETRARLWGTGGGAVVMGVAIAGMHYTGMAAARFTMTAHASVLSTRDIRPTALGATALGIATLLVLGFALLTAVFDRRIKVHAAMVEERSRLLAHTEEARAKAEQVMSKLQAVLDVLPVSVFITDAAGMLVQANPAARALWEAPASAYSMMEYDKYRGWWPDTGEPIAPQEWAAARARQTGEICTGEEVAIEAFDGTRKLTLNHAAPIRDEAGQIAGAVAAMLDITGRKQLEEERAQLLAGEQAARAAAENAVQMRDDVLGIATHDLRSPLTTVLGRAQLLQQRIRKGRTFDPAWIDGQMEMICASVNLMQATIDTMQDVARLQMGQALDLSLEQVDACTLVRLVAEEYNTGLISSGREGAARVVIDVPGAPLVIQGDRNRLIRVLQNVIGNAAKYSPPDTSISVSVQEQESWVVLTVRDTGVGIPTDELPQIFTHFYRASTAAGIKGTGVGLAGSKAIVEQHNGRILIESAVGQGTTVTVYLPRAGLARSAAQEDVPGAKATDEAILPGPTELTV